MEAVEEVEASTLNSRVVDTTLGRTKYPHNSGNDDTASRLTANSALPFKLQKEGSPFGSSHLFHSSLLVNFTSMESLCLLASKR